MKNNHKYSEISSFEDFKAEKERLRMKSRIIETKMELSFLEVKRIFSISNLLFSIAREIALPKISDLLSSLIKKTEKTGSEESGENQ
ncbi:MAG TPA: hypothetical protein PKM69_09480 [Bacteroidales bacterium]|nr:hypothetical protein [Bacteroidales bacterium]